MKTIKSNIWYADEARATSAIRLLVYSDTGSLQMDASGLKFEGEKTEIHINRNARVYLSRQKLNWVAYVAGGLLFAFLDLVIGSGAEMYFQTEWVLTKLYVSLSPICILIFWLPMKWLVVEYDAQGERRKAYFSRGDLSGFKGLFGGNRKLMKQLVENGLNSSKSQ